MALHEHSTLTGNGAIIFAAMRDVRRRDRAL